MITNTHWLFWLYRSKRVGHTMITSRKNDFRETMFLVIIERRTPGSIFIFYKILTISRAVGQYFFVFFVYNMHPNNSKTIVAGRTDNI